MTSITEYGYDAAGRPARVDIDDDGDEVIDRTETYDSDANGNRYPSGAAEVDVDAQDRLMSWGDLEFTYTEHGTLSTRTDTVSNETTTNTYDAFGHLRRVDLPDGSSITHGVDARGRRISRSVDGVEYDVFGKVESDSAPGFQPFGCAGGLYDAATGVVRFGAGLIWRWDAGRPRISSASPEGGGMGISTCMLVTIR